MRKVIYGGACSLDGLFADRKSAVDWLHFSKDVEAIMKVSWASADTVLLGRKTWEWASSQPGPDDPLRPLPELRQRDELEPPHGGPSVAGIGMQQPVLDAKPRDFVVALGDSYSSGEGGSAQFGTDYYRETDNNGGKSTRNACHRSPYTWSRVATLPGRTVVPVGRGGKRVR